MANAIGGVCHNDPNFAVICSFLDRYGELLGLPDISYMNLQDWIEDTKNVHKVLIELHVRLLRRIGKSNVSLDRWEKSMVKFCHRFSDVDAWEMERFGYKYCKVSTKLKLLKNLLESQFDFNSKFKDKVNELAPDNMRFQPIGRDKNGLAYWYLLDNELNLRVYREDQDDVDAETWELVCRNRDDLATLISNLEKGVISSPVEKADTSDMSEGSKSESASDFNDDSRDSFLQNRVRTPIGPSPLTVKMEPMEEKVEKVVKEENGLTESTEKSPFKSKIIKRDTDSPSKMLQQKFAEEKGLRKKNGKKYNTKLEETVVKEEQKDVDDDDHHTLPEKPEVLVNGDNVEDKPVDSVSDVSKEHSEKDTDLCQVESEKETKLVVDSDKMEKENKDNTIDIESEGTDNKSTAVNEANRAGMPPKNAEEGDEIKTRGDKSEEQESSVKGSDSVYKTVLDAGSVEASQGASVNKNDNKKKPAFGEEQGELKEEISLINIGETKLDETSKAKQEMCELSEENKDTSMKIKDASEQGVDGTEIKTQEENTTEQEDDKNSEKVGKEETIIKTESDAKVCSEGEKEKSTAATRGDVDKVLDKIGNDASVEVKGPKDDVEKRTVAAQQTSDKGDQKPGTVEDGKPDNVPVKDGKQDDVSVKEDKQDDVSLEDKKHDDVSLEDKKQDDVSLEDKKQDDVSVKEDDVSVNDDKQIDASVKAEKQDGSSVKDEKQDDASVKDEKQDDASVKDEKQDDSSVKDEKQDDASVKDEKQDDLSVKDEKQDDASVKDEKQDDSSVKDEKQDDASVKDEKQDDSSVKDEKQDDASVKDEKQDDVSVKDEKQDDSSVKDEKQDDASVKDEKQDDSSVKDEKQDDASVKDEKQDNVSVNDEKQDDASLMNQNLDDLSAKADTQDDVSLKDKKQDDVSVKEGFNNTGHSAVKSPTKSSADKQETENIDKDEVVALPENVNKSSAEPTTEEKKRFVDEKSTENSDIREKGESNEEKDTSIDTIVKDSSMNENDKNVGKREALEKSKEALVEKYMSTKDNDSRGQEESTRVTDSIQSTETTEKSGLCLESKIECNIENKEKTKESDRVVSKDTMEDEELEKHKSDEPKDSLQSGSKADSVDSDSKNSENNDALAQTVESHSCAEVVLQSKDIKKQSSEKGKTAEFLQEDVSEDKNIKLEESDSVALEEGTVGKSVESSTLPKENDEPECEQTHGSGKDTKDVDKDDGKDEETMKAISSELGENPTENKDTKSLPAEETSVSSGNQIKQVNEMERKTTTTVSSDVEIQHVELVQGREAEIKRSETGDVLEKAESDVNEDKSLVDEATSSPETVKEKSNTKNKTDSIDTETVNQQEKSIDMDIVNKESTEKVDKDEKCETVTDRRSSRRLSMRDRNVQMETKQDTETNGRTSRSKRARDKSKGEKGENKEARTPAAENEVNNKQSQKNSQGSDSQTKEEDEENEVSKPETPKSVTEKSQRVVKKAVRKVTPVKATEDKSDETVKENGEENISEDESNSDSDSSSSSSDDVPLSRKVKGLVAHSGIGRGKAVKRQADTEEVSDLPSAQPASKKSKVRGRVSSRGRGKRRQPVSEDENSKSSDSSDDSDEVPLSKISGRGRGGSRSRGRGRGKGRGRGSDKQPQVTRKSTRPIKKKKFDSDDEIGSPVRKNKDMTAADITIPSDNDLSEEETGRRRSARVRSLRARKREPSPDFIPSEIEDIDEDTDDEEFMVKKSKKKRVNKIVEEEPKGRNAKRLQQKTKGKKKSKVEEEEEEEETACCKCHKSEHPEWILLCDKCDAGFHTACLRPPLMIIPEGDWFCPPCEHKFLVEKLQENLKSLDQSLVKNDRLSKRRERLAFVGISLDNILKEEKKEGSSESSEYESFSEENYIPEKHKSKSKHSRYIQRSCRSKNPISYRFEEYDEMIKTAIEDDMTVPKEPKPKKTKPPGISRGKDMSNIFGEEEQETEATTQAKKRRPRLTELDEEEEDDDSEDYKLSEDSEASAVKEESEDYEDEASDYSDEIYRGGRYSRPSRRSSRKKKRGYSRYDDDFVVDSDYDSEEDLSRRSTRASARRQVNYREDNSEDETRSEKSFYTSEIDTDDNKRRRRQNKAKVKDKGRQKRNKKRKRLVSSDDSTELSDEEFRPSSKKKGKGRSDKLSLQYHSDETEESSEDGYRRQRRCTKKTVNYRQLAGSDSSEADEKVEQSEHSNYSPESDEEEERSTNRSRKKNVIESDSGDTDEYYGEEEVDKEVKENETEEEATEESTEEDNKDDEDGWEEVGVESESEVAVQKKRPIKNMQNKEKKSTQEGKKKTPVLKSDEEVTEEETQVKKAGEKKGTEKRASVKETEMTEEDVEESKKRKIESDPKEEEKIEEVKDSECEDHPAVAGSVESSDSTDKKSAEKRDDSPLSVRKQGMPVGVVKPEVRQGVIVENKQAGDTRRMGVPVGPGEGPITSPLQGMKEMVMGSPPHSVRSTESGYSQNTPQNYPSNRSGFEAYRQHQGYQGYPPQHQIPYGSSPPSYQGMMSPNYYQQGNQGPMSPNSYQQSSQYVHHSVAPPGYHQGHFRSQMGQEGPQRPQPNYPTGHQQHGHYGSMGQQGPYPPHQGFHSPTSGPYQGQGHPQGPYPSQPMSNQNMPSQQGHYPQGTQGMPYPSQHQRGIPTVSPNTQGMNPRMPGGPPQGIKHGLRDPSQGPGVKLIEHGSHPRPHMHGQAPGMPIGIRSRGGFMMDNILKPTTEPSEEKEEENIDEIEDIVKYVTSDEYFKEH